MTPPEHTGGAAPPPHADKDAQRQLWAAADSGWVLMVELISAVFTWGGIGWLLDRRLGTAPWLLITGFTLGWATGIYLAWHRHGRDEPRGAQNEEGSVSAGESGT